MITLYVIALNKDKAHAATVESGFPTKPTPVTDNVTEVDVPPKMTTVSTDSKIEVRFLYFYVFFIGDFCLWSR